MKNMKNRFLLMAVATVALAACSKNETLFDVNGPANPAGGIQFGIADLDNVTRTSKTSGASFTSGDQMAVYGFQDSENLLFNNQLVENVGKVIWQYSPVKYWQTGSSYKFYAMYPYSQAHSFNTAVPSVEPYFVITDFTVNNDQEAQVDVMIAQENRTLPFNTVDFVFNHLLCNVNFMFRAKSDFDFSGIDSIAVDNFDVTGLNSKGTYTQTAWDASTSMAVGAWSGQTGTYDFPAVTSGRVESNSQVSELATDLLLMPQQIADEARLQVTYTIYYSDESRATFTKGVRLASIKGSLNGSTAKDTIDCWNPNFIYNYTLAVNPAVTNVIWGSADYNGSIDLDQVHNSDIVVDEDTVYWVDFDEDGAGDYRIVWEDIDGDGFREGGVDLDGDGHIDDLDADGTSVTPGTESTNKHWGPTDDRDLTAYAGADGILVVGPTDDVDPATQLEHPGDDNGNKVVPDDDDPPFDPSDPYNPNSKWNKIDWNGSIDNDGHPSATLLNDPTREGEYMVDIDNDGVGDYPVVWEDIDGDGVLEGGVDRDGDGLIDNVDDDGNLVTDGMSDPRMDMGPSDEDEANTGHKDVILMDLDGDDSHIAETQLERIPEQPLEKETEIEFSATVQDWAGKYDAPVNVPN